MKNITIKELKENISESVYTPSDRDEILESLDDALKILDYAVRELNKFMDVYGVPKARSNIAFAKTYIAKAKRELL